uniref:U8-barytoxin-Tl1a n=1 Tax=Trittame loki TaxID=1295018 RepID=ICK1_TRILK|nr:RecName: Full=U8-barytoxin-Tl1a; Short=U8-BATX-Tl1a; AltName: Full=Toxin ICK-1; Flags: Precursor [Trittame loki]
MKTLVLVAVLGLASLYLLSYASEVQQLSVAEEEFGALIDAFGGLLETEERGVNKEGCRKFLGGCENTGQCCLHLFCKYDTPFNHFCAWDLSFGRK